MKYLIVYRSHHGTTQNIAMHMAEHLGKDNTTLINLKSNDDVDPEAYETIIIGGSIHGGQVQKEVREFCEENKSLLLRKRVGLFLCGMATKEKENEFTKAFPEWLTSHATTRGYFGGELLLDKMNLLEKVIVKGMMGQKKDVHALDKNAIDTFEKAIIQPLSSEVIT